MGDTGQVRIELVAQLEQLQKGLANAGKDLEQWALRVGDTVVKAVPDKGVWQKRFEGISSGLDGAAKIITSKMQAISAQMTSLPALVAGGAWGVGTKAAMDFAHNMAGVSTQITDTSVNMEELSGKTLELASRLGKGASETAQALRLYLGSGGDLAHATEDLTIANKASVGGWTDLKTAIDVATSVLAAYGRENISMEKAFDAMFIGVREGKMEFADLARQIADIAPLGAQVGVSFQDLMAAMGTLTRAGAPTSEAATQLKQIMVSFLTPSKESIEAAEALDIKLDAAQLRARGLAETLTLIKDKLAEAVKDAPEEIQRLLKREQEIMALMAKGGKGPERQRMKAELKEIAKQMETWEGTATGSAAAAAKLFGNVRALIGVMTLGGSGNEVYRQTLEMVKTETGATQIAFDKMSASPMQKMTEAMNRLADATIKITSALLPIIEAVASFISQHPTLVAAISLTLATILGLVAPVLIALSSLFSIGATIIGWFSAGGALAGVGAWIAGTSSAISGGLMTAVTGIIGAVTPFLGTIAIALAVGGALYLFSKWVFDIVGITEKLATALEKAFRWLNIYGQKEREQLTARMEAQLAAKRAAAGMAMGGIVKYLASGGPSGTDTVPAMLTPGEFVIRRSVAQKHLGFLSLLNAGAFDKRWGMALGGLVRMTDYVHAAIGGIVPQTGMALAGAGTTVNVAVNISGGLVDRRFVERDLGPVLERVFADGLLKLRRQR